MADLRLAPRAAKVMKKKRKVSEIFVSSILAAIAGEKVNPDTSLKIPPLPYHVVHNFLNRYGSIFSRKPELDRDHEGG